MFKSDSLRRYVRLALLGLLVAMPAAHAALFEQSPANAACPPLAFAQKAEAYAIEVDPALGVRSLQGSFFGFNTEWVEFQLSLWDESRGRVRADLVEALKPFVRAVYRYPGGATGAANDLDWREAESARGQRPKAVRAGWTPPMALDFGPEEYLNFVQDVGGTAWYIANLHGRESGELKPEQMAAEAGALAGKLAALRASGKPGVLRWELGNELERSHWRWPPDKLARVANMTAAAIRKADPLASFVILQQEYAAMAKEGFTASQYNRKLVTNMSSIVSGYAMHFYYDANGDDLPLARKMLSLCDAIRDIKTVDPKSAPAFWITEHARVPKGMWKNINDKSIWTGTGNLQAAISAADMIITAAMIPEVQGAFLHSLHGTAGPWPLFHRSRDKTRLYPSAVFLGVRMLRESMLPLVLQTQTRSRIEGEYEGGYDLHAVVMSDEARQRYSLWAINRSHAETITPLRIPALRKQTLVATLTVLADAQLEANNYASPDRLKPRQSEISLAFDAEGRTSLSLPAHSVYTLQFDSRKGR